MAPSASFIRITPSVIETGRVVDVDIQAYSLTCVTQYTKKPLANISFSMPYHHYSNGEGIYFMPEVGSLVWLCFPSDGSRPFVLGWAPARGEDNTLRSQRVTLNPGDIYLGTRDENFIYLRRGGVVQIGAGPLSQRIYLPIQNTIQDFCENYGLHSLGGDLEWTIDRQESTTDGSRPALLRIKAREYANDPEPIAILEIGSHPDSAQNILSLVINASGQEGAARKITVELRKDGSALFEYESNVNWIVKENLAVRADKDMTLSAGEDMSIDGATLEAEAKMGAMSLKAATAMTASASAGITLAGGTVVAIGPTAVVGGGTLPALLGSPTFIAFLTGHKHGGGPPPDGGTAFTVGPHLAKKLTSG